MKNLIIKTGALGDVLRSTILLNELSGEVYWITKRNAKDLLQSKKITKIIFSDDYEEINNLKNITFDLVISLEEEKELLKIIKDLNFSKLIGVYLDNNDKFDYTSDSSEWFDMSLVSKYSRVDADKIKMQNRKTHSQIFIEMLGRKFTWQEYDLGVEPKRAEGVIGLVDRCGDVWPNKNWFGYEKLKE